jgi:hypothetical protein
VNDQSEDDELDSARRAGEPASPVAKPRPRKGRPVELRGSVQKLRRGARRVFGDGMVKKAIVLNRGDLFVQCRSSCDKARKRI